MFVTWFILLLLFYVSAYGIGEPYRHYAQVALHYADFGNSAISAELEISSSSLLKFLCLFEIGLTFPCLSISRMGYICVGRVRKPDECIMNL